MIRDRLMDIRTGGRIAFERSFTLEEVVVNLRFRWLARIERWLVEMFAADGGRLSLPQVVQPSAELLFDRRPANAPPGRLLWTGPDDYTQASLGVTLTLLYIDSITPERRNVRDTYVTLGIIS